MGRPINVVYGSSDIGSAVEDVKKVVAKIETNKFGNKDLLTLATASNELIKAVIADEYED